MAKKESRSKPVVIEHLGTACGLRLGELAVNAMQSAGHNSTNWLHAVSDEELWPFVQAQIDRVVR